MNKTFLLSLSLAGALLASASVPAMAAPAPAAHAAATAPVLTETAKIEALIAAVEAQPDAVFIRNGIEHDARAAADHLRLKWHNAGKRVATARDFIRYCASESSMTGRKYRIRFADGREVDSADFFNAELARIEGRAVKPSASR